MSEEEEKRTNSGFVTSRIEKGKCYVSGCKDTNLLDCIRCKRHDLCFNHMGGKGFTRIFCEDCIKAMVAKEDI